MSSGGISMYEYVDKPAYVIVTCILTGLAILCNLFLIITILFSSLRSSAKHLAILALCLVDIYEACSAMTLVAQFYSTEEWIHDVGYFEYLDFSQPNVLLSFRTLLMITICGVTLMSMFTTNQRFLNLMSVSMVFASLFYSLVLILPNTIGYNIHSPGCFWDRIKIVSHVSFFPQATILLILLINICIVSCCCTRSFHDVTSGVKRFPGEVAVAAAVFLVFTIPYSVVGTYFSSCSGFEECQRMHISRAATMKWEQARYFLLPLMWLICPDVRRAVTQVFCCRKNNEPSSQPSNQVNKPYNYQPNQAYYQPPNQPYIQPTNQPYIQPPNQAYYQPSNQPYNPQAWSVKM